MMKRQGTLPILLAALGVLAAGAMTALADDGSSVQLVAPRAVPPSAHYAASVYYQDDDTGTPFVEEEDTAPLPDAAYDTPTEAPPEPLSAADVLAEELGSVPGDSQPETNIPDVGGCDVGCDSSCGSTWGKVYTRRGCSSCGRSRCVCSTPSCGPSCGPSCDASCGGSCGLSCGTLCGDACGSSCGLGGRCGPNPCLPKFKFLSCSPIEIHGWIDQGVTVNNRHPVDRFHGPVAFNDREGEYMMNQAYLYMERKTCTGGYGFDVGGRIDAMYGTDWRFTQALGFEDSWNESERFYGGSIPQMYMEAAVNNLTVRMGRYYTIIGYETVPAPDNFFYSHAYTMLYGEPFTHTGLLASYKVCDGLTVMSGFDRGWDKWEDNNNKMSYLGGVTGTSWDGRTSLSFALTSGFEDDAGEHARNMYSIVFSHKITHRLQYVLQHDRGQQNAGGLTYQRRTDNAEWYGINQYLIYRHSCDKSFGVRFEWFRDDDGTRVGGVGAPHGWDMGPDIGNGQIGWAGDFFEVTVGMNWEPCPWLRVRPECRWDWYSGPTDAQGRMPYNSGRNDNQFTFGTDVIMKF